MKIHVTMTHRLIGAAAGEEWDTSADLEVKGLEEAVGLTLRHGLRQGHEVTAIRAYVVETAKAGA